MVRFSQLNTELVFKACIISFKKECECNLSGTLSGSSSCTDNDGDCQCNTTQGYTGTKCDECLGGWWWLTSNRTCMGNVNT